MKSNLELETTKHMKNCINFVRRHEICRVWDVSLSHYPSLPHACEVFLVTKGELQQINVLPHCQTVLCQLLTLRTAQGICFKTKKPLRRLRV